ncbi:MAG: flippase-like domain-containing protein [Nitrospirae bacterium]|nr:flippase-like domain-containing protein [Nitrospirota bacterium]
MDPKNNNLTPGTPGNRRTHKNIFYRKAAFFIAKAAVSSGIIVFLLSKIDTANVIVFFKNIDPLKFSISVSINLLVALLSSYRLMLFIPQNMPAGKVFSINLIGLFFNNLLPGSTGGDAIKFFYIFKHTGQGVTTAGSVFMDRLAGFTSVLLIGFVSAMANFGKLRGTGVNYIVAAIAVAFFIATFAVFSLKLGKRYPAISKFYDYFHLYIRRKKTVIIALVLSTFLQVLCIFAVYVVSLSLKLDVTLVQCLVFIPIIFVIMSVPISISGFGIREGAFVFLFGIAGVNKDMALALSFGWFLSVAISSLPGLVLYVVLKPERGLHTVQDS